FGLGVESVAGFGAGLEPHFAETLVLPVGEEADTVGGGLDGVEVVFQLLERKIFVNVLAHREFGLDVERDRSDHAESAEADNRAVEGVAILRARELHRVARRGDELQAGDGGGEIAVFLTRAVSAGAARAGYGNVRQRG